LVRRQMDPLSSRGRIGSILSLSGRTTMKYRAVLTFLAIAATFALAMPAAGHDDSAHGKAVKHAGLEQFKALAGDWVGKMSDDGKTWNDATVKYTVTSAGTAVVETLGPGTKFEMVTVIHPDGKELGLTHYCAVGNQPHMKASANGDNKTIAFEFTGASNMKSDKDMHMHNVAYTFVDQDTLRAVWTHYQDGKAAGTATFEFKRKK
jgi:hypothetical protein